MKEFHCIRISRGKSLCTKFIGFASRIFSTLLKEGIGEELKKDFPIVGYGGKYQLEFLDGITLGEPELDYEEMRKRELTCIAFESASSFGFC